MTLLGILRDFSEEFPEDIELQFESRSRQHHLRMRQPGPNYPCVPTALSRLEGTKCNRYIPYLTRLRAVSILSK